MPFYFWKTSLRPCMWPSPNRSLNRQFFSYLGKEKLGVLEGECYIFDESDGTEIESCHTKKGQFSSLENSGSESPIRLTKQWKIATQKRRRAADVSQWRVQPLRKTGRLNQVQKWKSPNRTVRGHKS